jgi:hypothetical protein
MLCAKNGAFGLTLGTVGPETRECMPRPATHECIIASAVLAEEAKRKLARLRLSLNTLICCIETSAEAIEASQKLLANLPAQQDSD